MPICNVATGENLSSCLQDVFTERSIPWTNLVGYSSDNAPVMAGGKNSVLSRIREKQPKVVDVGCVCHIMSTFTQYGVKKLDVPLEELLQDVFQHFQHSSKRRHILQEFREFTQTETYKLVRHCSTRWLSLQSCVDRFLQQWPALLAYFNSHEDVDKPNSKVARIYNNLSNPQMELTFRFLSFILKPLNEFNTIFQNQDSMTGYLHNEIVRVIGTFMAKFVKMSFINKASEIIDIDYKARENQHPDDNLAVGMAARTYLHVSL